VTARPIHTKTTQNRDVTPFHALLALLFLLPAQTARAEETEPPPALALFRVESYASLRSDGTLVTRSIAPFTLTLQRDEDWVLLHFRNSRKSEHATLRLPILKETNNSLSASSRRGDSLLFLHFDQNHLTLHRLHTADGSSTRLHATRITP